MFHIISTIFKRDTPLQSRIHWILRITCFFCLVGHGAWGIIQKPEWIPFYDIFHIPAKYAYLTMPIVGLMDILMGILILVKPMRFVLVWMVFWTIFTALLRPMAFMGWFEFLERAGNYGAPIVFLALSGIGAVKGKERWIGTIKELVLDKLTITTPICLETIFKA